MARLPTALIGALALARGMPTAPDGTLVPFDGALELEKDYFKDNCKSKDPVTRASKCCVRYTPSCYALEAGVDVEDDFSDCGKYYYQSTDGSPKACRKNKGRCGQTGKWTLKKFGGKKCPAGTKAHTKFVTAKGKPDSCSLKMGYLEEERGTAMSDAERKCITPDYDGEQCVFCAKHWTHWTSDPSNDDAFYWYLDGGDRPRSWHGEWIYKCTSRPNVACPKSSTTDRFGQAVVSGWKWANGNDKQWMNENHPSKQRQFNLGAWESKFGMGDEKSDAYRKKAMSNADQQAKKSTAYGGHGVADPDLRALVAPEVYKNRYKKRDYSTLNYKTVYGNKKMRKDKHLRRHPKDLKNEKFGDILEINESPEEDEFDEDEVDEDELDEDEFDEDESDEYWEGLDFDGEDEDELDLDED